MSSLRDAHARYHRLAMLLAGSSLVCRRHEHECRLVQALTQVHNEAMAEGIALSARWIERKTGRGMVPRAAAASELRALVPLVRGAVPRPDPSPPRALVPEP